MNKKEFNERFFYILPNQPGIYKYYDINKRLLYVGKAKDLKKRVNSYFGKNIDNRKTAILVSLIHHIEWTITNDEHDAFLLENSLIKHLQPPFNINLKDDKTYPFVVIKNEPFPRVYLTRNRIKDGSEYIGPFTDVSAVRSLLSLIKEYIPLRTCSLNLQPKNIEKGKFKVCLEYHIGNCKGPCESLQSEEDYKQSINLVRQLLKGNLSPLTQQLKEEMKVHVNALEFEKAQQIKKKLEGINNYKSKSTVISSISHNIDIASILMEEDTAYVNYMIVANGQVIQSKNLLIEKKLEEDQEEILSHSLAYLRKKFQSESKEIVLPFPVLLTDKDLKITLPKLGAKKNLLDLSFKNASYFKLQNEKKLKLFLKEKTLEDNLEVLHKVKDDLQLPELPVHIECFDNSNLQGTYPVAAMVCFKNGQASKKDYRHFHIKTVSGINDFASMEEVVYRRYKRLIDEEKPLPQLIIIDGGKGQLSSAMKSIKKLGISGQITVLGLAEKEEKIFFPNDKDAYDLPYNGDTLLFIRKIRDEVHRFGLSFHRKLRSKGAIKNELELIPGIGKKTAQHLLQTHRSVNRIKQLTLRELTLTLGASKARLVHDYFHPEKDKE